MNNEFSKFIFATRRYYRISALVIAAGLKFYLDGVTSLSFFVTGIIFVIIGQSLRTYSAGHLLGRHTVTKIEADFLCTSGPYAYIRNPLYLGNLIVSMGVTIALNEWYIYMILVIKYIFLYTVIIPYEERFLQSKFGDAYSEYKSSTGSFIPKLKGYKGADQKKPDYKAGFLSEVSLNIFLFIVFLFFYMVFVK
ncbi:MAG: isoprenylcysteine carboxylmethyltransferase family protein [Elusimicrobia bacterium]|nr:isoprenylcysteine carboxylmethyltransferase family protein [Elusimicrobiota bacterium]